jgi:predicted transcriptional regulator
MSETPFPRSLLRRAEKTELSLGSLEAIVELRKTLDRLEHEAILSAKEKGATVEDIAEALGLTPQAIYHRLRNGDGHRTGRGRPKRLETSS